MPFLIRPTVASPCTAPSRTTRGHSGDEALWVTGCEQDVWQEETLVMLAPWKTLANIPPEERRRKEVQLTVNLARALTEITENASHELRLTPCDYQATTNGVAPEGRGMNLNQELVK